MLSIDAIKSTISSNLNNYISFSTDQSYLSTSRIYQTHSMIYIIGIGLFIIFFLATTLMNSCFKNAW